MSTDAVAVSVPLSVEHAVSVPSSYEHAISVPVASASKPAAAATGVDPSILLAVLAYDAAIVICIVAELGRVSSWSVASQMWFALPMIFNLLLLPLSLTAVYTKRFDMAAFCAILAAIMLTGLMIVVIMTRFYWGTTLAAPVAGVVMTLMFAMWYGVSAA